jgi:hypothetical protein
MGLRISRRGFLATAAALAMAPSNKASAQFQRGVVTPIVSSGLNPIVSSGWNTLPLGAGGLVTGFNIAPDGTMVCRTDVGNIYRWTGVATLASAADPTKKWVPLMTYASMGSSTKLGGLPGGYELVIAPSKTTNFYGIMYDDKGLIKYWVYYSINSGATWKKSNLAFNNADPNGNNKTAYYKIAVDPNNENVVYVGMPISSGNSCAVYRAIDGQTFSPITSGDIGVDTTVGAGCCGICFDPSYGTTTVGGQLRTARIIIPVGGVGIFESLDGGETFTEIAVRTFGSRNFYVFNGVMNSRGVYYSVVPSREIGNKIRRYSGPGGTWSDIDPTGSYGTLGTNLVIDPRLGHEGFLMAFGPNGIGIGFTTNNADTGSRPKWSGATSGQHPVMTAPSYDIPYINYIFGQNTGNNHAFMYGTAAYIDANGVCWWSGNQSFFYFTAVPNYGGWSSVVTRSVSLGRGMESTVAQDILVPPGGTYPILAPQDLGVMQGTFTTYPTDYFVRYRQSTCESLEYSASDPSFIVARTTGQGGSYEDVSAYSKGYNVTGNWKAPASTPTSLWQADVVGEISNGAGAPGNTLTISAVNSGIVQAEQWVTTLNSGNPPYITGQVSGAPGGVGVYTISSSAYYRAARTTLALNTAIQGGQTVVADNDHWVTVPAGYGRGTVPAYTANATSPSCTWKLTNLPASNWMLRSWIFGQTSRPFAVGYGPDLGTVWAARWIKSGTIMIYKSTDYGATFTLINTLPYSVSTIGIYLLTVPGYPGELWLSGACTGSSRPNPGSFLHSTDGGVNWNIINMPAGQGLPLNITLGAAATPGGYPTIYMRCWATYGAAPYLYEGQWNGNSVAWSLFGPTGTQADLPESCQLCGIQSIRGDFNTYRRLYVASNQSGFAYYNP